MSAQNFEETCSKQVLELLSSFREGTHHLSQMAQKLDIPWDPKATSDPRRLHNSYVRNLVCCYASKVADLSQSILAALSRFDYLTYALCGRALIETVANLRYYVVHRYKPLLDKGNLLPADVESLISIDDQHLRGTRFDWEAFLFRNYSKLKQDTVRQLTKRKSKGQQGRSQVSEENTRQQVNVITCIEKWAEETPEILIAYNLFCDLVHPNMGSNFLVASMGSGKLYFSKHKGGMIGHRIFEQSFPILVSATHKPFGQFLTMLMATIWHDDELA
ncbi:hypothetical protein M1N08_00795 [Dehalococcoidia bacterium]|nr:hypothetical protein [Dehalococcoidia bacterium]